MLAYQKTHIDKNKQIWIYYEHSFCAEVLTFVYEESVSLPGSKGLHCSCGVPSVGHHLAEL